MPVYVRKNLMSITPDTLSNRSSDEEDFITDPDQMVDNLPQPFRLVNKIVRFVFDAAWELVCDREEAAEILRSQIPIPEYDNADVVNEYKETPNMISSTDGTAMFVALPNDITVIHPITHTQIASWKPDKADGVEVAEVDATPDEKSQLLDIHSVQIGVQACLLITVDKSGCCRMFIYSSPYLLFVRDFEGDILQGSKVTSCTTSRDGDYLVLNIEGESGDVWLDVFKLPKDSWVTNVEHVQTEHAKEEQQGEKHAGEAPTSETIEQPTESEEGTAGISKSHASSKESSRMPTPIMSSVSAPSNWNPANLAKPSQVLRVRAPSTSVNGCISAIQPGFSNPILDDWISTIGLGNKHQLTENHLQQRRAAGLSALGPYIDYFKEHEEMNKDEKSSSSKKCNCVFVSPGNPLVQGVPLNILSEGIPHFLVCGWEGTNNLCYYNLLKTAKDLEHKPDKVTPFASRISSLALSQCGSILGVGLENGSVSMIDQQIGTPLAVENISASSIIYLDFPVSSSAVAPSTPAEKLRSLSAGRVILLAGTARGGLHSLIVNYEERKTSCFSLLAETRNEEQRLGKVLTVPSLKNVVLVMSQSGGLSMFDYAKGQLLCRIKIPSPYKIEKKDMEHAISLAANGQKLFVKGTKDINVEDEQSPLSLSALLAYQFHTFDCLDTSWKSVPEQEAQSPTLMHIARAKQRVDWIMASHLQASQVRQVQIQARWKQLREEAQAR